MCAAECENASLNNAETKWMLGSEYMFVDKHISDALLSVLCSHLPR